MKLGVISDTHGLLREEALAALMGVDLILHAGDVGNAEILERLRLLAPVHAVRGNVDKGAWALELPLTEVVEVEGISLYMLHDLETLNIDPAAGGFAAVIYGHSHRPEIRHKGGVLYLNPGSAGAKRFSLPTTLAIVRLENGTLTPELVSLL